jgi:subtilisin family serine protease
MRARNAFLAIVGVTLACSSGPSGRERQPEVVGAAVHAALAAAGSARVVVALSAPPPGDSADRQAAIESLRRDVLATIPAGGFSPTHEWSHIAGMAGALTQDGLAALARHPSVVRVDLDVPAHAHLPESRELIRADDVHSQGIRGRGVVVAVIDTGVDEDHPDLRGRIIAEECFCAPNGGCCPNKSARQSGAGAARDDNGHGTNVAGIIAGGGGSAPLGIAPDSELVAIKVLSATGEGTSSDILSAFDHLIANESRVKIVNLSLGLDLLYAGQCDGADAVTRNIQDAVATLRGRGTLVFASSGNNGETSKISVPACLTQVVAVGAVYDDNIGSATLGCTDSTTARDQIACFSNSSSAVDLLAPGALITATGLGGGTSSYLGTSQACPHAAAAAALLWQANPGLSPDRLEQALKDTGVSITDRRNGLSFRRIDVAAARDATR